MRRVEGTLVERGPLLLVSLGWTGPYAAADQVQQLWKQFFGRAVAISGHTAVDTFISPRHARKGDFTVYLAQQVAETPARARWRPGAQGIGRVPGHRVTLANSAAPRR